MGQPPASQPRGSRPPAGPALSALIASAGGTGGPAAPSSRYYGAGVEELTLPDGPPVRYLVRRIIPQSSVYSSTVSYVITEGDRLDNLAQRFLGDPALYWMICDANGVTDPDELTAQAGQAIVIPVAAAIPPGARNG
jgi:nucleoid-associated protein YgaU